MKEVGAGLEIGGRGSNKCLAKTGVTRLGGPGAYSPEKFGCLVLGNAICSILRSTFLRKRSFGLSRTPPWGEGRGAEEGAT